jgi:hypothetical protein
MNTNTSWVIFFLLMVAVIAGFTKLSLDCDAKGGIMMKTMGNAYQCVKVEKLQ